MMGRAAETTRAIEDVRGYVYESSRQLLSCFAVILQFAGLSLKTIKVFATGSRSSSLFNMRCLINLTDAIYFVIMFYITFTVRRF
jgi:hypothetical protein